MPSITTDPRLRLRCLQAAYGVAVVVLGSLTWWALRHLDDQPITSSAQRTGIATTQRVDTTPAFAGLDGGQIRPRPATPTVLSILRRPEGRIALVAFDGSGKLLRMAQGEEREGWTASRIEADQVVFIGAPGTVTRGLKK